MLKIEHLTVAYQNNQVVQDVSFNLEIGQIGCLLGPSGCGKTSLLRAIAGFEHVTNGEIYLRDELVSATNSHVPPQNRRVALVFQDYALFPHLNVSENIAFGLHKLSKTEQRQRVSELLMLVDLQSYDKRYPHELSGGQQQRVALARALADKPDLLLLDEPFSSLDAELRDDLAKELRAVLKHEKTTALMVTHDQHEAFAMADIIGVMHKGCLLQWANAYSLYHRPANRFVATFVGDGVFLTATVDNNIKLNSALGSFPLDPSAGFQQGDKVVFLVRPDDVVHDDDSSSLAKVLDRSFQGSHILYELELQQIGHDRVLCLALSHHDHQCNELIGIKLDLEHLIVFKDDGSGL
jgi:iron(III) transport system ATP-binding protein